MQKAEKGKEGRGAEGGEVKETIANGALCKRYAPAGTPLCTGPTCRGWAEWTNKLRESSLAICTVL